MLVSDIERKVKRIFGEGGEVFITQADVIDWINDGINQIIRETKCNITTTTAVASTFVSGVQLPTGFIQMVRVTYDSTPLPFVALEDLDSKYSNLAGPDSPVYYYVDSANKMWLFPGSSASDSRIVSYTYTSIPTALTTAGQTPGIPERYHEDLVIFCKMRAYERNQDQRLQQGAYEEFNARISLRIAEDTATDDTYAVIRDDPWEW